MIGTGNNGKAMWNGESPPSPPLADESLSSPENKHGTVMIIEVPISYGTGRLEVKEVWNIEEDDASVPFPCHVQLRIVEWIVLAGKPLLSYGLVNIGIPMKDGPSWLQQG